jgi:hypothetical protein
MADFSLGAAIGATGKFPKLKVNKIEDETGAQTDKELAAIRSGISADRNKYHNVYIDENKNAAVNLIQTIFKGEKTKDPNRVENAYVGEQELAAIRSNLALLSKDLFDIEDKVMEGDMGSAREYIPKSLKIFSEISRTAKSQDELFNRLKENPEVFVDGYLTIKTDPNGLKRVQPIFHNNYDFEKILSSNDIFNLSRDGQIIKEDINKNDKEKIIQRIYSIPATKDEARELQKLFPEINLDKNAYDIGKNWFSSNPLAQKQFRSQLYWDGIPDAQDPMKMNNDQLYDEFYNKFVVTNIPAKYENKDQVFRRTNINVNVSTGQKVAPTSFQMGPMTSNYKGKPNGLSTQYSSSVSSDPAGTQVQLPTNRYMINMDTGNPEFTETAMKDFFINRIAILPAAKIQGQDGSIIFSPLTTDEVKIAEKTGDVMYYPFAIGNTQPIKIGTAPDIGKFSYAIPLYEPNAKGEWVIPKESRRVKTNGGSPTLSQIINRNSWNEETQANWDATFFNMMAKVVDENDAKANKKAKSDKNAGVKK